MPQIVEIPELGKVEFPDNLPPEEIQKIIETELFPNKKIDDIESGLLQASKKGTENILQVYPLVDALTSFATGIFGSAAGGYAGAIGLILGGTQTAKKWQKETSNILTWQPITEEGQELLSGIEFPFQLLDKAGNYIADKVYDRTKNAAKATIAGTIVKGLPLLWGLKGIGKGKTPTIRRYAGEMSKDVGGLPIEDINRVVETGEAFRENLSKLKGKTEAVFSVEKPFARVGAPETGFHVKNIPSILDIYSEKGMMLADEWVNKIKSNTPESRWADYLGAEFKAEARTPGAQLIRESFDKIKQDLKDAGVKGELFPESLIKRLQAEWGELYDRAESNPKSPNLSEWQKRMGELEEKIARAKEIEYVHYPFRMFMESMQEARPEIYQRTLNWLTLRKRKTVSINDLVKEGELELSSVDPLDIVRNYHRKVGRDIAYLKVVEAAKNEGMALYAPKDVPIPESFVRADARFFPILKDYAVHPAFADFLIHRMKITGQLRDPIFGTVKMLQFYNPFFLPAYDVWQGMMLGTLRSIKTPGAIYKAIRDVVKKTPEYWEAKFNGTMSKPYELPWNDYIRYFEKMKGNPLEGLAGRSLKSAYRTSWFTAWYLDNLTRQISYRVLLEKGYSPREAAQITARAHSDYASIPIGTRRVLNKIFFTPTFKFTMAKFFNEMAQSGPRVAIEALRQGKISGRTGIMLNSGIATAGILAGIDYYMQHHFGGGEWKRDPYQYGRRYSKKIIMDDGQEKELVFVIGIPPNMPVKYLARGITAWKSGQFEKSFLDQNKWELHPIWRIAYEIRENKDPETGLPIFRSDPLWGSLDKLWYTFKKIFAMTGLIDEAASNETARKKLDKDIGRITSRILQPFTFVYLRDTLDIRTQGRMKMLMNERTKLHYQFQKKGKMDSEELKNHMEDYVEKIEETREELIEIMEEE